MSRGHAVARAVFYVWFSTAAGLLAMDVLSFVLIQTSSAANVNIPWDGLVAWITAGLFVLGMLVFGQWEHFGERVRVVRWGLFCAVTTLVAMFGFGLAAVL